MFTVRYGLIPCIKQIMFSLYKVKHHVLKIILNPDIR